MATIKYKDGDSWVDIRNTLYPVCGNELLKNLKRE